MIGDTVVAVARDLEVLGDGGSGAGTQGAVRKALVDVRVGHSNIQCDIHGAETVGSRYVHIPAKRRR